MIRTCKTCLHCRGQVKWGGSTFYVRARCALTGKVVSPSMLGCSLHLSEQDVTTRQQAQDENWRPGAPVPLAVSE